MNGNVQVVRRPICHVEKLIASFEKGSKKEVDIQMFRFTSLSIALFERPPDLRHVILTLHNREEKSNMEEWRKLTLRLTKTRP